MSTEPQVFLCQNRDCGCEIVVTKTPLETKANPRCFCGAEMKKPYSPKARSWWLAALQRSAIWLRSPWNGRPMPGPRDRHFRNLRIRLASLRPLLADSRGAQKYL